MCPVRSVTYVSGRAHCRNAVAFACLRKHQFPDCRLRLPTSLFLDSLRLANETSVVACAKLVMSEDQIRAISPQSRPECTAPQSLSFYKQEEQWHEYQHVNR